MLAIAMNDHYESADSDPIPSTFDPQMEVSSETKDGTRLPQSLEKRICRLEDAVAHLQDTRSLEERLVERVTERVERQKRMAPRDVAGVVVNASRALLPAVVGSVSSEDTETNAAANRSSRLRRPWLLFDMVAEARAILRMFVDPRYRLSWRGRLAPLVLVVFILTSSFWIPGTGLAIVGPLFDKCLNLIVAFILFRILSDEARRYRETAPDLPPSLRL